MSQGPEKSVPNHLLRLGSRRTYLHSLPRSRRVHFSYQYELFALCCVNDAVSKPKTGGLAQLRKARSFLDGISYAKIHVFHGAYDSGLSETRQGAPVELFSKTLIYLQGFGDTELYVIGIRIFIVNV